MIGIVRTAAVAAILLAAAVANATAQDQQDKRRHQPSQFDFYVLALSWSPTYCQETAERGRESREQCGSGRPYAFVVHGLWPQYDRCFPRDCQVPPPRLNLTLITSMLDLIPAPRLVFWQPAT